jgi:hypothetical protein
MAEVAATKTRKAIRDLTVIVVSALFCKCKSNKKIEKNSVFA